MTDDPPNRHRPQEPEAFTWTGDSGLTDVVWIKTLKASKLNRGPGCLTFNCTIATGNAGRITLNQTYGTH